MTSLVERLRAIRGDDAARAVFADELSHAGDPRGEHLNLLRALWQMPVWQRPDSDQAFAEALVRAPAYRAWAPMLGEPPAGMHFALRAGLPTCLVGKASDLEGARRFELLPAIDALELDARTANFAALTSLGWLGQVDDLRLDFGAHGPTHDELARLVKELTGRPLSRFDCGLPAGDSAVLMRDLLPSLAGGRLSLSNSSAARVLEGPGLEALLTTQPPLPLRELSLFRLRLSAAALRALTAAPDLERLALVQCQLPDDGLRSLSAGLPRLKSLTLEGLAIDWDELASWLTSPAAPGLEVLWASVNALDSIAPLATALARRKLRRVALDTVVHAPEVTELVDSGALATVESLMIRCRTPLTSGLGELGRLQAPGLSSLMLENCGVDGAALARLAGARWLPQLRLLDLSNNKFPNEAVAPLLLRPLPQLRRLVLPANWAEESPVLELLLRRRRTPNLRRLQPAPPPRKHLRTLLEGTAPPLDELSAAGTEDEVIRAVQLPLARDLVRLRVEEPRVTARLREAIDASPMLEHLAEVWPANATSGRFFSSGLSTLPPWAER